MRAFSSWKIMWKVHYFLWLLNFWGECYLDLCIWHIIAFTKGYDHNFMTHHISGSEVSELNPLPVKILWVDDSTMVTSNVNINLY